MRLTLEEAAAMIDHTNLHADATEADMAELCREARENGFAMVAVNSVQSAACARILDGTPVHVGAAIGFPLGQTTIATKVFETRDAIANGANEIDYVVNLTAVKDGLWDLVKCEMRDIVNVCRENGVTSKVIFENCYLTKKEKLKLCEIAGDVKPDFIKTSTGFGTGGATFEDIELMAQNTPDEVKVKAAGGIRDGQKFLDTVRMGADRVGATASLKIMEDLRHMLEETGADHFELDRA